jgi:hypothetical protein
MPTIFHYTLVRFRGQIFGWGLALLVLGFPIIFTYDVVMKEQEKIKEVAGNFAPMFAALGGDLDKIASPSAYLSMRCFAFMPLILGLFAVLAGSGLLAASRSHARRTRTPGPISADGGRSRWSTSSSRRRTHGSLVEARITPAM